MAITLPTLPSSSAPSGSPPWGSKSAAASNAPANAAAVLATTSGASPTFRSALQRAATSIAAGDRLLSRTLDRGTHGRPLDAPALIELQAGVYRYTQELELAGRLVDRATQAVKTTLQSQS